jgi:hypothetical protein
LLLGARQIGGRSGKTIGGHGEQLGHLAHHFVDGQPRRLGESNSRLR